MAVQNDCREACGANSTCINECDDTLTDCLIHRPCRSECPDECTGCSSVFCQFKDAANILALGSWNPEHKKAEILRTDRNTWSTIGDYPDSLVMDILYILYHIHVYFFFFYYPE